MGEIPEGIGPVGGGCLLMRTSRTDDELEPDGLIRESFLLIFV